MGIHIITPFYITTIVAPPPAYGPEETVEFHPDAHPETTSVDGYASAVKVPTVSWSVIHGDSGTEADDDYVYMWVEIRSSSGTNKWFKIQRVIITFDTSSIPVGSLIVSAKLELYLHDSLTRLDPIAINIYGSNPVSNTALEAQDYSRTYTTPFSTPIDMPNNPTERWETWNFNADGLAAIIPGGITKLAARESNYDAPNNTPTWYISGYGSAGIHTAETPNPLHRPKLTVVYQPPL